MKLSSNEPLPVPAAGPIKLRLDVRGAVLDASGPAAGWLEAPDAALERLLSRHDAARVRRLLPTLSGATEPVEWLSVGPGGLVGEDWLLSLRAEGEAGGALLQMRDLAPVLRESRRRDRLDSLWDMAAGVAHEFNNRLTAALGNSFRLRARLGADSIALQPLERLEDALLAMDRLTGMLLQFTALGGQEPRLADLGAWLDTQTDVVRARVPAGVAVDWHQTRQPLPVRIDGDALSQALLAMVDNAVEAMLQGRGQLRLSVSSLDRSALEALNPAWLLPECPTYARLSVVDDGSGIAADMLDRAVEPFVSSRQPGRGLGLAVVLGIAQRHNGGMHIRRLQPRGTEVMLFLPMAGEMVPVSGPGFEASSRKGD
jgi:signal transduction histidine kinase